MHDEDMTSGTCATALLTAALLLTAAPAHATARVLHRHEAMSAATFAAEGQLVRAPALRCWDKPGSSPSTRTCLMADGHRLRVHEQRTGYLVWRLDAPRLDLP